MVEISQGSIQMRDDRIGKEWNVSIKPFLIAKYPVTQETYQAISDENPSTFKGDNLPVETVSWVDAVTFCNQLSLESGFQICYELSDATGHFSFNSGANGFRLPTEAEWQYACRAGTSGVRYGELNDIAWHKENSGGQTQPIGEKAANAWGLHDMLGNVWEWCNDIYDETVYGSYRIFRGGGWCDIERSIMATTRRRSHPVAFRIDDLGFRIARNHSSL